MTPFAKYFDDVAIINLKSRPDRKKSILEEVARLGFSPAQIRIPDAPICESDGGFPSRGVFGNYLSHLEILKTALSRKSRRVLVLEDDAIFSRSARNPVSQARFIREADSYDWATWHLGHKLRRELRGVQASVVPTLHEFHWAHCYAVQDTSLMELVEFLELLMSRPTDHPDGGKMYIDGALYHFRADCTQKPCLVSNPPLSVQKGSDSNLAGPSNPGIFSLARLPKTTARYLRDELWRRTGIHVR